MPNPYTNKAVILSLYDTGLATARCLGRLGIPVAGYDHDPSQPGFYSRYCKAELCPNPTDHPGELLDFLLQHADPLNPSVLFPCSDEYVLFVSRHRDSLGKSYAFLLPEHNLLEQVTSKDTQSDIVNKIGIAVPQMIAADNINFVEQTRAGFKYPIIIKPVHGHIWKKYYDDKCLIAQNHDELVANCRQIFQKNIKVIIQEIIPGPCSNNWEISAYVGPKGNIRGEFVIRKIRQYPPDFGFATMTVSAENNKIVELGRKIINGLDWRGFINIEFKLDPTGTSYKFIELNPRVWQQVNHAENLHMNFPLMQYLDLTGNKLETAAQHEIDVKWMDLKWDMIVAIKMILRHEMTLRQWFASIKGALKQGLFALDDIHPFLHSIGYGAMLLKIPKLLLTKTAK